MVSIIAVAATACAPSPATQGPKIVGEVSVGVELTASRGDWLFEPSGYGYRWSSCDVAAPSNCQPVGTNSSRFTPTAAELGRLIVVEVTATNPAGSAKRRSAPVGPVAPAPPPGSLVGATQIAVGGRHSCALVAGGQVRCWGWNDFGQLGNGTFDSSSSPVTVLAG
jgi:hypothetical protein